LLDTGGRYIPEVMERLSELEHVHLHRYLLAAKLAQGIKLINKLESDQVGQF
jgi:hypothetical protein